MTDTATLSRADLEARRTAILAVLDNPDATPDQLTAATTEAAEVRTALEGFNARTEAATAARAALLGVPADQVRPTAAPFQTGETRSDAPPVRQSAAAQVIASEAFAQFRARGYSGQVAIDVPDRRALIDNSGTSGGAFQNPARPVDVPMNNADRAPRLADLIDRRPTDSNTVEYVQETTAGGAGNTAGETAEGGLKPEATFTFVVITDSVRTIAHWTNITRQTADDNAQLTGYVQGRLGYGLEFRLDSQIINGTGTSPQLRGILNTSGTGVYVAPASEAAVLSIRKAMTVAQGSEYAPDTCVLNPLDWERVELSTDSQGMFRVTPNVSGVLAPRIWGLNVVATTAIAGSLPDPDGAGALTATTGRFIVGSFRMGATLWEREGVRVMMTDSHASNFTSNILTLLAEMRAALSIWRPKAFVVGSFSAGTN
jgi:HK97 family phage major capsid protein